MKRKLEIIDYLRGFSIFTIVLMHLLMAHVSGVLSKMIAIGGAGVHVFILVSGFGLYLSYLHKPLSYGSFLKKRFWRVYCPYAVIVVLWALWSWWREGCDQFKLSELASHLFLYKMFDHDLDVSLCYPFWYISTIIQFYIFWPLIVRLFHVGNGCIGVAFAFLISISWSTLVGVLGYEESRPWGSCFLQYLWEFVLGMWMANSVYHKGKAIDVFKVLKWQWLIIGTGLSLALNGFMGWQGGAWKLYNDIPSLFGYLGLLLIAYRISLTVRPMGFFSRFFSWASAFSYELFLVHSLVFALCSFFLDGYIPLWMRLFISLALAYLVTWSYNRVMRILQKR